MTAPGIDQWLATVAPRDLDADPDPVLERLRAESPVAWYPPFQAWLLTRWEDCRAVAADRDRFGGSPMPSLTRVTGEPSVLGTDGDVHADLRSFVDPQLRPRAVNGYVEAMVRPIARGYLDALGDAGHADLVSAYFEPVSVRTVGDLLGLRQVDDDTLRRWFHGLAAGIANATMDPAGFVAADAALAEIRDLVGPMLARLAVEPDSSGLSHWLHDGMPQGRTRSAEYVYPTLAVMLTGGLQEPGHGAANTLLGLFGRPDQLAEVRADPTLVAKAVAEGLRWMPPISVTGRRALRDVEVGGCTIAEGSTVLLMLGSANRDGSVFDDPDSFDMHRTPQQSLAFGGGDHLCAGHYLARHIERIALETLLERFPGLAPAPDQPPVTGWAFRSPSTMEVTW